jgi:hypothetical protein
MDMTVHRIVLLGLSAFSALGLLAACGGGGGDAMTPAPGVRPTTAFALAAGYKARIASGATDNFNLSGSCTGTATISTAAAAPATFEGVTGYSSAQASSVNFTNCAPATSSATGSTYYNASYATIGLSIVGGEYASFAAPPSDLPVAVKVGDTADIATLTTYTNSTKTVAKGRRVLSYVIEGDTNTTAIVNLITRSYDLGNVLLSTEQSRYHVAENGTLTRGTIDVQFSSTSTLHLLYTPK